MSSNLKVNTILPSTGTNVAIGTAGGSVTMVGNVDIDINSGISTFNDIHISDKIVHEGDTNTTIRFPAADTITAETGGSERLRIDSNGRLLVGTTTEGHANADDLTIATTDHTGITLRSATNRNGSVFFSDGTSGADEYRGWIQYTHTSDYLTFGTNGGERLRITSDGKVGINTDGPSQQFTSYAASGYPVLANGPSNGIGLGGNGVIVFGNKDLASYGSGAIDASNFAIKISGSEKLRITSTGTHIGSNGSSFDVNGDDLTITNSSHGGITIITGSSSDGILRFGDGMSGSAQYQGYINYKHADNALVFGTQANERLRIASNGTVYPIGNGQSFNSATLPNGHNVQVNTTSSSHGFSVTRYSSNYGPYGLNIGRSKSNTIGTNSIVANGDDLGHITWYGADGTDFNQAAVISAQVDGSPSDGTDMPGRLIFKTSSDGSGTPAERLRIASGGNIIFPSVESSSVHAVSTADVEIGGRHIWKRITSSHHVTTATNVNHFYLGFFRSTNGNQKRCYYNGVVVNVIASGGYDWSGHGYVTHTSQTLLTFNSNTGGRHHSITNSGYSYLQNNAANMQVQGVGYSYDSNFLYANFRFTTNESGTGWKPHYNVEVIDPSQCTYTCVAF